MICPGCQGAVSGGVEIVLNELSKNPSRHCPYCLEPLVAADTDPGGPPDEGASENVSVERFANRRTIRQRFIEELRQRAEDGKPLCPSCGRLLERNDILILSNSEYFRCPLCGHDIAAVAYRQEAYREQRWLPVVEALEELHQREKCRGCCYAGAMAKSCQTALSWIGRGSAEHHKLLVSMLASAEWRRPECEPSACPGLEQYRKQAGKGLELL